MKVVLTALALGVTLSGCMLPPAGGGGAFQRNAPIRAYITPPTGGSPLGFQVNRPAYVAMFEVVPGRGTALIHPSGVGTRMDGLVYSGWHTPRPMRVNRDLYFPTSGYSTAAAGPRFFFLIASERPLDLGQLGAYGMGLRSMMGAQFGRMNAYSTMEQLTRLVVADVTDPSWTTDMYVYWPEAFDGGSRADYVIVSCNGHSVRVRRGYANAVYQSVCAPATSPDSPADPSDPADSTRFVVPERRAPQPRAEPGVRERITSSDQLRNGGAAAPDRRLIPRREQERTSEPTLRERSRRRGAQDRAAGGARTAAPPERAAPADRPNRRAEPSSRRRPAAEPTGGRSRSADPPRSRDAAPSAEPSRRSAPAEAPAERGSRRAPPCDPCAVL